MPLHPLLMASASDQARAVAAGQISAAALLQLQVDAIDQLQPALNAYIARTPSPDPGQGRSALSGSSFAAKDNFDVAGLPASSGLRALARVPARDAAVVARLRAAGLACLGKLNMHPMALGASNHNPDYGDCFNPVRAGFTPGGSSGGSGAAVAAGLCGLALGSDTMGSVRIPAAYCGVVGFKPSHETLGLDGVDPLCRWLDHAGLLARSVEDISSALAILAPHLPAHPQKTKQLSPPQPQQRPVKHQRRLSRHAHHLLAAHALHPMRTTQQIPQNRLCLIVRMMRQQHIPHPMLPRAIRKKSMPRLARHRL